MSQKSGPWMETFSGRQVYPLMPDSADVCLEDIAHALSMLCRFTGHSKVFYSVGQHSVLVSQVCQPEHALIGLLHDATEAYLGDMGRPLKSCLPAYKSLESVWALFIGHHFKLGSDLQLLPPDVKQADEILLATERRDVLNPSGHHWNLREKAMNDFIVPLSPAKAEELFLARYLELTNA